MNFAYATQNLTLGVSKNHHLLIKENNLLKSFRVICHIHVIRLLRWAMVQYSKILLCLKSSERNILDSKNFLVEQLGRLELVKKKPKTSSGTNGEKNWKW